jgi:hypothetical protein
MPEMEYNTLLHWMEILYNTPSLVSCQSYQEKGKTCRIFLGLEICWVDDLYKGKPGIVDAA